MSKTCMQNVFDKHGMPVRRRRPHDLVDATYDPNNGYAKCSECGREFYVGTGIHPNLGVPYEDAERESAYLRYLRSY